ncbi:MAG: hypothetical protein PHY16_09130 [Methylobacter sp.]|nr:hypothetical protein [Methylobacter sp.]
MDILETSLGYNVAVSAIIAASPTINDTPNLYDGYSGRHSITSDDFQSGGRVNQFGAQAFTSYLNTINYAGSNQWVLPSACINPPQSVNNQTNSQFGEQFYSELGGTIGSIIPTNSKFTNEQASSYWLGTEAEPGSAGTTNTVFFYNHQRADVKTEHMYA